MFNSILFRFLLKAILVALIALVLYGAFPASELAVILVSFAILRLGLILIRALRTKATARPVLDSVAEALGVVAFSILIPLDIALYSRDFFSFRLSQGWAGVGISVVCVALYLVPLCWLPRFAAFRIIWWGLPFVVSLPLLVQCLNTRHRYLNPFASNHNQLAAERVLLLRPTNNIVAGTHADWVLRYARELDARGDTKSAIYFYREGLRLNSTYRQAYARLQYLETQTSGEPSKDMAQSQEAASAPYWTAAHPITPSPRQHIEQLTNITTCTVVVAAVGDVPEEMLDAIAFTIHSELNLPVYISQDRVSLPPYTRIRGVVVGKQWKHDAIVKAFAAATKAPRAPIKYVLITPVDIYLEDSAYAFSANYDWGAVVSSARFGGAKQDKEILYRRTAKQTLGALLKSFRIPASPDRNCVTTYTRNLEEFDAKGNRPNEVTLKLFRQAVDQMNSMSKNQKSPLASE